jgi:hypothetical protein
MEYRIESANMHDHQLALKYIPPPNNGKPEWAVKFDNWLLNGGNIQHLYN